MEIKHVLVRNFRGIRHLDWRVDGRLACLVGPGDSKKTTILRALEYALSPRYTLNLTDADFYQGDTSRAIRIEVTVGELPDQLLSDENIAARLRGWSSVQGLVDEPEDDCEDVLTIRLSADESLEPAWEVVTERELQPLVISWRNRAKLGAAVLGENIERTLSWARGSALTGLTADHEDAAGILAKAHRAAKDAVDRAEKTPLTQAAKKAQDAGQLLGVVSDAEYAPALDSKSVSISGGALSLHEGMIPLRALGLGSARLLSLGIQRAATAMGAILVIDELEAGLEPHRLRRLIRVLRDPSFSSSRTVPKTGTPPHGQAIATTHSPVAIVELLAKELRIVRSTDRVTNVLQVPEELQGLVRKAPEAFLAKRIVVCEGKTELGLWRSLRDYWQAEHADVPVEYFGTIGVYGEGRTNAPRTALELASLGF